MSTPNSSSNFHSPKGGLPSQTTVMTDRAIFTEAYAVIPKGVMTDIVTSNLPHWEHTRAWIIARPLSGFAETFSQYIMEVMPNGGSAKPEPDPSAQCVMFVTQGQLTITHEGITHQLGKGGYAYLPAGSDYTVANESDSQVTFHWVRKRYLAVDGIDVPRAIFTSMEAGKHISMPDTNDTWVTTRFVEPDDLRHDMHVNIVTFQPGGVIPFAETHVMEHGIFILEGKAVYHLNQDWVEVEAGDFLWLRAFCPQACYAGGPGPFRYLLYKDVNRHMSFF